MTTTNTKKELIDFLWEWATPLGNWSQILIQRIIEKNSGLDSSEREDVFNYYLEEIGFSFEEALPKIIVSKPAFNAIDKEVTLKKLSEINGVNKLATNQEMEFSPNITVIYGNNGVGKTGYSRILKAQGYSFDKNNQILSDINQPQIPQSAKIDFSSDGVDDSLDWNGSQTRSDLNSISVFNSNCVNISLESDRALLVSPQGFYLFEIVKSELEKLAQLHTNYYTHYPASFVWKEQLHESSPQWTFIDSINRNSDKTKLNELSHFTKEKQEELEKKEKELADLNRASLVTKIQQNKLILSDFDRVINQLKLIEVSLLKDDLESLKEYNAQLKKLKEKSLSGISDVAKLNGVELYESDEFNTFLKSADIYIKLLDKQNYPNNDGDTCVYCKQEFLDENAQKLVSSYSKILNDTTQTEITKIEGLKKVINDKMYSFNESINFNQPAYGIESESKIIQPEILIELNKKVKVLRDKILNNTVDNSAIFDVDYTTIITKFLEDKKLFSDTQEKLKTQLVNIEKAEIKIKTAIGELKDCKLFSEKKSEIETVILNLSARKLLDNKKSYFRTDALSRKTTQAREELVSQDFQNKFSAELSNFRKSHLSVTINFRTSRGSSHISQKINDYNISEILSEGEQKAIALAEFLTELQLDNTKAPVIFDDPVNSLDHHIIDDTARRLIELSKSRQVVIFTHSVLLNNSLYSMSNNPLYKSDREFKFYKVNSEFNSTGVLSDGLEINKIKTPIGKLNNLIQTAGSTGRTEEEITKEGYGYLRTSLEMLISQEIFHNTIQRYRKNIAMTGFPKIKGDLIEKHKVKLNEIFERSSGFITGHSNPEPIDTLPKLTDLTSDFEAFKVIRAEFSAS